MTPLYGHTSPETAYVVDDYPYGFRLRCKIRYWLEYKPGKGYRFMSQTTNPKVAGEVWNKPKASTYASLAACMYKDESTGHIHWDGLSGYSSYINIAHFVAHYPKAVTRDIRTAVMIQEHTARRMAKGETYLTINGVRQPQSDEETARLLKEADQWKSLLDSLPL